MKHRLFECTQEAGDLMYVPTNWLHALVNVENSIGMAVELGHNTQLLPQQLHRFYAQRATHPASAVVGQEVKSQSSLSS